MRFWLSWVACMLVIVLSGIAHADTVRVSLVEVRLVYAHSGELSENVADPNRQFALWNTVIGEGDAKEPANDVLVLVHFERIKDKQQVPPISIAAYGPGTSKPFEIRRNLAPAFIDGTLAVEAMLLHGVTCGEFDVVAKIGKSKTTTRMKFPCGE